MSDRVSDPGRALLSGLLYMYVQEQPGSVRRRMCRTFLTADRGPAGGAHLWGPVCVCYCWERQGLASEVIRAAACLSLSLQPENTLLFRTTLTAPLPLPRRLCSLLSKTQTGSKREAQRREKGVNDKRKRVEERQKNNRGKYVGRQKGSASKAVAQEVFRPFSYVKVAKPQCRHTALQVPSCNRQIKKIG